MDVYKFKLGLVCILVAILVLQVCDLVLGTNLFEFLAFFFWGVVWFGIGAWFRVRYVE